MKKLNYIGWIKIFFILLFFFIAIVNSSAKIESERPIEILIGTSIFFLLSIYGIPAFSKADEGYYPKWNDSPFLFEIQKLKSHSKRFPLIFFHFSGYWILAIGIASTINILIRFGNVEFLCLQQIILGTGFLIGVYRAASKSPSPT
ncbi:MAG: hypothetical protein EOO47_20850 [Flavobacterium sp.]|nr:MAG: hypothetical protein EOO47_20850 [Flavobacterium sp.]